MKNANILVPIDFSELSYKALESAVTFAKLFDGAITPFHSYVSMSDVDIPETSKSSEKLFKDHEQLEKKLAAKLDQKASQYVDSEFLNKGMIQVGNPADAIIEAAQNFDLIVMTTHGRTGFSRLIMGSVAEKVIRFAPVPVVVVEEKSSIAPLEKILLTTDFSEYSLKAVPFARSIAEASKARLDIIHVVSFEQFGSIPQIQAATDTKKKQMRELVEERFSDMKDLVKTDVVSTQRSIHEKITKIVHKGEYNLVIMATIGRTGLEYLRLGSTASNVVRHVENAVFTVNPRRLKGADKKS
ncbi:universal stress protein [Natronogracilivirga saccharolytica]|uniref:Universal stress protein n=1 Tax=Natronogracilivirga saccharolytica TaxID=2812953 RepID=A0A8J7UXR6_9BACT|nr:universal stress protein [Natronogracilivirga saccharolytica]MBP3193629.1 universal stress protein [Natronogracilivirga saccharolytica]